jgi:TolA-binding protein
MRSEGQGSTSELDARLAESVGRVISENVVDAPLSAAPGGRDGSDGSPYELQDRSFGVVEQRLMQRQRRTRRLRVTVGLAAVVAVAGGTWGRGHLLDRGGERITYQVGDGQAQQEGNLIASTVADQTTDVRFSDGTRIQMEPRARGRIVTLDRRGAKVALYQGKLHVDVRHRANARWLFQAGPFEVRVHGTSFSISWNVATARFDLQMESGVVSVAGPISGGEMVLHAGQTLSVSLGDNAAGAGTAAAPVAGPPIAGDRMAPDGAGPQVAPPAVANPVAPPRLDAALADRARAAMDWRAELASGHASEVVADAERRGLGRVLARADSENLAALADAARYVGQDGLARRALHTQRRRFPRSKRAAEASFLLGRLEDESAGGTARALAWYDHYLSEAPSGALVSEALGRKMMVLERARRHDEAVAMAADYLHRFPAGSYAHAAEVIAGSSGPSVAPGSPRGP